MATEPSQQSPNRSGTSVAPDDKSAVETARILYEHVSKLIDEGDVAYDRAITKVDKLLIVNTAMFAGIAYGMQNLAWIDAKTGGWKWIVLSLAGIAGIVVLVAFIFGIRCLFLSARHVAGVQKIRERIGSRDFSNDLPLEVYKGITSNLVNSLIYNRQQEFPRWNRCLNWGTVFGAVAVALFLAVALGGSVIHK